MKSSNKKMNLALNHLISLNLKKIDKIKPLNDRLIYLIHCLIKLIDDNLDPRKYKFIVT